MCIRDRADLVVTPTAAPALVTYALVHGELLTLRPFPAGNGLVARAAGRLVLIARGLDPKSVSVPEVGHRELHTEYAAAARDYAAGTADGLARWVRHCGRAVALGPAKDWRCARRWSEADPGTGWTGPRV